MVPAKQQMLTPQAVSRWPAMLVVAILVALATATPAGAATWLSPLSLPGAADGPGYDAVAAPDGTVIAVWTQGASPNSQIVAAVRPPGGAFNQPEPISEPGAKNPRIAVDGGGNATVVWAQLVESLYWRVKQSTRPAGGDWSVPRDLSSETDPPAAAGDASYPEIAVSADGTAIVVWEMLPQGSGWTNIWAAARPAGGGGAFGPPKRLSKTDATAFEARIAMRDGASGIVTWYREDGSITRVEASPWSLSAGFGTAQTISSTGGAGEENASRPDVEFDAGGNAVFVWEGVVSGSHAIRMRTRSPAGVLGQIQMVAPIDNNFGVSPLRLARDGAGNMLATWSYTPTSGSRIVRAAYRPTGTPFQGQTNVSGTISGFVQPSAAFTARGAAVVTWQRQSATVYRVQARVRTRDAGFGAIVDLPTIADPGEPVAIADSEGNAAVVWRSSAGVMQLAAYDDAPPRAFGIAVPPEIATGRPAPFSAAFLDTWSPFVVSWNFGDGQTANGPAVSHAFAAPGTYTLSATASDATGQATTFARAVSVRPLRPDEIDADGDGFSAALDCDDRNRAIHPGAREIPGNAVDENCDGRREPYPVVSASVYLAWLLHGRKTTIVALRVLDLQGREVIRLSCSGGGCRKSMNATVRVGKGKRGVNLAKRVRGARLKRGARINVRISRPGHVAKIFRYTMRGGNLGPRRQRFCQAPGQKKPRAC
jgi:hypothetical protein